jgi:hypothetical protein
MTGTFTAADVVGFLDRCLQENPTWAFIDLGHPYVYTANSRLTLYADQSSWALVSEVSGYNPRADAFLSTITWLGNHLERLGLAGDKNQFTYNIEFVTLIKGDAMNAAVEHFEQSQTSIEIQVRDQRVLVPAQVSTFVPKIAGGSWPKDAEPQDIGRYIAYEYADLCRATNAEKRMHLPGGLPELMIIDQWHHRRWFYSHLPGMLGPSGDAPSSYETYRLIAEVLATRDPSRYAPTLKPNSHWSNWPEAGSL